MSSHQRRAPEEKTLRVGLLRGPQDLDPWTASSGVDMVVLHQIFETPYAQPEGEDPPIPVIFRQKLTPEPGSENSRWSAPVCPDLRFSDGSAATIDDVVTALAGSPRLSSLAAVEAKRDRIVFTLARPRARFDLELTQMSCALVRKRGKSLIGTGPFVLDGNSGEDAIRLHRNPHHRAPVPIEDIELKVFPPEPGGRPERLLEAIQSGQVDVALDLSRQDLSTLSGLNQWVTPGCSTAVLYLNVERPVFADVRVRTAIALAIDRTAVARTIYTYPGAFVASSLLPPTMGHHSDALIADLPKARALLKDAECSVDRPLEMQVIWGPRPYLPDPARVSAAIADEIRQLGFEVNVRHSEDIRAYYQATARGSYDLVLAGWIADTLDPASFFEHNLSSASIPQVGESRVNRANLGRWSDRATDAAIEQFRIDPSNDRKRSVLDLVKRQVPLVPLLYGPIIVAHSFRVKKLPFSPLGFPRFASCRLN